MKSRTLSRDVLCKLAVLAAVAGIAVFAVAWGAAGVVRADPDPDPTIGTGALTVDGATAVPPTHWDVHQSTTYHMHIDGITEYSDASVISAFVKGKHGGGTPFVDEIPSLTVSSGSIDFYYTTRDTACATAVVAYGREVLLSNAGAVDPAHSGSAAHLRTVDAVGDVIDCVAPTPTPTRMVGGMVEIRASGSGSAVDLAADSSDGSWAPNYVAIAGLTAPVLIILILTVSYARRRWLR